MRKLSGLIFILISKQNKTCKFDYYSQVDDVFLFILKKTNENVNKRKKEEREDQGEIFISLPTRILTIYFVQKKKKRILTIYFFFKK